uniref:Uncharacterized protein n=1 Tax=Lepeophtheirus salmonis TaxID=72036 RepID=A0A0K2UAL3_LEPSM
MFSPLLKYTFFKNQFYYCQSEGPTVLRIRLKD